MDSPSPDPLPTDASADSAAESIRRLIAEVRAAAANEAALLRVVGDIAAQSVKGMGLWGIVALLTAFVGLLALAVAGVFAVAAWLGPWWAMLIVPSVLFAVTGIAALLAKGHLDRLKRALAAWKG